MLERRATTAKAFNAINSLRATILIKNEGITSKREIIYTKPNCWRVEETSHLLLLHTSDYHVAKGPRGDLQIWPPMGQWFPDEEIGYLGWGHPDFLLDGIRIDSGTNLQTHDGTGRQVSLEVFDMQGKHCTLETDAELGIVLSQSTDDIYAAMVIDLKVNPVISSEQFSIGPFSHLPDISPEDKGWVTEYIENQEQTRNTTFWNAP